MNLIVVPKAMNEAFFNYVINILSLIEHNIPLANSRPVEKNKMIRFERPQYSVSSHCNFITTLSGVQLLFALGHYGVGLVKMSDISSILPDICKNSSLKRFK